MRSSQANDFVKIPTSENESWGFWGTMGGHASIAWPIAMAQISKATGEPPESIRVFLDSSHGRHFADSVQDALLNSHDMHEAVAEAIEKWMSWKIGRLTQRSYGIPKGLPYLTGFVIQSGIDQDCT
ncbi:hypothetical protein B9Z44_06070 [Limnohabitans curvus]|jgi:hypothetical protein|uniref:Uncharacterized protein n=1 Tax=Limnohabitans curvus TaxID=323423 RepID=A0A315ET95_9BURK|nr:hypothetical protein [Limnohabitans curvus]PUE59174.1 hypothetical protein B9Z44_06070 [Limnohabitans curvus]